jgi:hypothetical protein
MSTLARLDVDTGTVVMRAEEGYDAETALEAAAYHARHRRRVRLQIGRRRLIVRAAAAHGRRACSRCGALTPLTFGRPASADELCARCARGLLRGR